MPFVLNEVLIGRIERVNRRRTSFTPNNFINRKSPQIPVLHRNKSGARRAATTRWVESCLLVSTLFSSLFKDPISVDHSGGTSANIQASLAGRYATALFELARDSKAIDAVEQSMSAVAKAIGESADLKALTTNPVLTRADAKKAIAAVAASMKLDALTAKTLGVLANNRRLGETAAVARAFTALAASHRGEVTAEVTSAHPLSAAQMSALSAKLKGRVGSDVAIQTKVDPAILGGLTVKIGSQMIDNSIKTRLNTLANAMKG